MSSHATGGDFNRRAMVFGMVAAAATAVPAKAGIGQRKQVEIDAAALAVSMEALHGGVWSVRIDHERRLVLIMSEI